MFPVMSNKFRTTFFNTICDLNIEKNLDKQFNSMVLHILRLNIFCQNLHSNEYEIKISDLWQFEKQKINTTTILWSKAMHLQKLKWQCVQLQEWAKNPAVIVLKSLHHWYKSKMGWISPVHFKPSLTSS